MMNAELTDCERLPLLFAWQRLIIHRCQGSRRRRRSATDAHWHNMRLLNPTLASESYKIATDPTISYGSQHACKINLNPHTHVTWIMREGNWQNGIHSTFIKMSVLLNALVKSAKGLFQNIVNKKRIVNKIGHIFFNNQFELHLWILTTNVIKWLNWLPLYGPVMCFKIIHSCIFP